MIWNVIGLFAIFVLLLYLVLNIIFLTIEIKDMKEYESKRKNGDNGTENDGQSSIRNGFRKRFTGR